MSFKITIINNDNGEVIASEENAKAIIGAIIGEEHTNSFAFTSCTSMEMLCCIEGVDKAKKSLFKKEPKLEIFYHLANKFRVKDTKDDEG